MILRSLVRHMLHESVHRSAALATVVSAVGLTLLLLVPLQVRDGEAYYWGQRSGSTATLAREFTTVVLGTGQTIWVFLPLLAVAGLLAAALQKGWIELLFSKPMPRIMLLGAAYATGLILWMLSVGLMVSSLAAAFRWTLHVPALPLLKAFAVLSLFFASELAFLVLVAVARPNVMIAAAATFAMTFFASVMGLRVVVARYFDSRLLERALDGLYYILPKVSELASLARRFADAPGARVTEWMPLWSTALFGAACLVAAGWLLQRKDF